MEKTDPREYLRANQITQRDLAERIKCSEGHLSLVLRGRAWPSRELVIAIERETGGGLTANDFVHLQPSSPSYPSFRPENTARD